MSEIAFSSSNQNSIETMTSDLQKSIAALKDRQPEYIIGPRPGKKSLPTLSMLNLTHCCTLLSAREQAQSIEKMSHDLGCEWVWLPIEGGRLDILRSTDLAAHIEQLADAITATQSEKPRIYVHCSAGIHRTGFFVYTLLRLQGLGRQQACTALRELRPVTAEQVGDERLDLADTMVADLVGSMLQQ